VRLVQSINWGKVTAEFTQAFTESLLDGLGSAVQAAGEVTTDIFLPDEFQAGSTSSQQQQQQSPGLATTTNNASGSPVQLDGFEVNKRTGRYSEGEVAGRGGTLGI
jgi:hypothetical protein